ncbi:MAG: sugar transferase, partial [Chloroflexi bacterium]
YYDLRLAANRIASLQRLFGITLQMLVVYLVVFFLSPRGSLPRLFILYYGIASFVLLAAWRMINPALLGWASEPRRLLIVGTDWAAQAIINAIREQPDAAYDIKGIIGDASDVGKVIDGVPVIGAGVDLLNFVQRDRIAELVVTSTRELAGDIFQGVMDAYERGVTITPMPLLYERLTGRVPVEHINNSWAVVLPIEGQSLFNAYRFLKRFLDITLSLVGMVFFLAALPFIALVIRLESKGPIFYTQERVGLNGRIFNIIKFRTMVADAEIHSGPVFAQQNDPRVTRVGRFMRKTRLDEIPQFINVLRGDMSLVGPRPERPFHVERLQKKIPFYRTRHVVRPGVTGWAQVRYNYGSTDEDALIKLQYDLYYIRKQSLLLDLNIMIRTAYKMIRMSGT